MKQPKPNAAPPSAHALGVFLVVISAFVFSTAGIFTNGVAASAWVVIFWRGLAAAGFTTAYMIARGTLRQELRAFGWPAFFITLMMATGTAAFIPAFKYSSVANVALIYASAPFVAATLGWVFIREAPSRTIVIAAMVALIGVAVIVFDSLGNGTWIGDLLALVMTVMMSGAMVMYRKYPKTTAALPAVASSLVLLPVAMIFGAPFAFDMGELPILIAFGLIFAIASVTLSEGARRLPSGETALISTLEMPLAPVLALLILSEVPSLRVILGGLIILSAVLWSQTRQTP